MTSIQDSAGEMAALRRVFHNEDESTLTAIISTHEIGERVEELHRKFRWESFEVDHLQDLRLFQVRMEIPLKRVKAGSGIPDKPA